jgi:hypothetical protein
LNVAAVGAFHQSHFILPVVVMVVVVKDKAAYQRDSLCSVCIGFRSYVRPPPKEVMIGKNLQIMGKFRELKGKLTLNMGQVTGGKAEQRIERFAKACRRLRRRFEFVSDD